MNYNFTYIVNNNKIKRKWYLIDVKNKILGRIATKVSEILIGKRKSIFTPYIDVGDYVIIINASKIRVTGKKMKQKKYYRHSQYVGGIKSNILKYMFLKKPENILKIAIKGMLPKNSLGRLMYKKLYVYPFNTHNHIAQNPFKLDITC